MSTPTTTAILIFYRHLLLLFHSFNEENVGFSGNRTYIFEKKASKLTATTDTTINTNIDILF